MPLSVVIVVGIVAFVIILSRRTTRTGRPSSSSTPDIWSGNGDTGTTSSFSDGHGTRPYDANDCGPDAGGNDCDAAGDSGGGDGGGGGGGD